MARHSSEMSELEAEKERLLLGQEKELHQRHVQHVREIRALWEEEQHEAVQKEKQMIQQRHQAQLHELRTQHDEEVHRLQEQLRRDRQRAADDRTHFENEAEQIRRIAHERAQAEADRVRDEEEGKRRAMAKKHATEMASLKENESADRAEWERICRFVNQLTGCFTKCAGRKQGSNSKFLVMKKNSICSDFQQTVPHFRECKNFGCVIKYFRNIDDCCLLK